MKQLARTVLLYTLRDISCEDWMLLCTRTTVQHRGRGPQVVALGNLLPADAETDELDSWMFQTVGHQLVEAYAACTGLPLLRRHISGASCNTVRRCGL